MATLSQLCFEVGPVAFNKTFNTGVKLLDEYILTIFVIFPLWTILFEISDSYHPKMLCDKIGWYWLGNSREEGFKTLLMYWNYLSLKYAHLEKRVGHHLNKLLPKKALCQVQLDSEDLEKKSKI